MREGDLSALSGSVEPALPEGEPKSERRPGETTPAAIGRHPSREGNFGTHFNPIPLLGGVPEGRGGSPVKKKTPGSAARHGLF